MHRVAITGLGCISALGHDADSHWSAARDGVSGIDTITAIPPEKLKITIAAEIKGFDAEQHFDPTKLAVIDPYSQYALVAARQAVNDSGLNFENGIGDETAVIVGTGIGGAYTIDNDSRRIYGDGKTRTPPMNIPKLMPSAAASHVTMEYGLHGPAFGVTSACSSANHAIGEAFWMVRSGRARAAVTGGSEACLVYGSMLGWQALRVLSVDTCRPFCIDRKGMVLGEGAGILVLERLEDAKARGAKIYAEIAGMGLSSDAGSLTDPSSEGAARAISQAVGDAGLTAEEVDYVNAHGTGTGQNDVAETKALRLAFGNASDKLMISSTKSMHGHGLGAAGALEAVITARAIADQVAPPTANFTTPDPECDLDYIPNVARDTKIDAALSNSFAFGGLNAVLAFKRVT
ncbi:MAG: beta-ketoacyl-[acyl-carrier-protein] synthase family protein [Pseudomonadota bacterium]